MQQSDKKSKRNTYQAFTSLLTVILLSMVVISAIFMGSIISIDNNIFNKIANESIIAGRAAYSCAEIALNNLKSDLDYAGSESIDLDGITCNILEVEGSGNTNRTIKVSAVTDYNVVKKIQIEISEVNPTYIFNLWQEVADFY
jgi:hypothetical protein